jgi:type IV pilus assembly protein PilC
VEAKSREKQQKQEKVTTKYRYKALDAAGKTVSGVETAGSSGAVHIALIGRGFQPLEVELQKSMLNFEITKKKVPRKDVMNFSRQLAVFMRAGIPIM